MRPKNIIIKRTVYWSVTWVIVLVLLFSIFRVMPGNTLNLAFYLKALPEKEQISANQDEVENQREFTLENKTIQVKKDINVDIFSPLTRETFVNSSNELRYTVTNPNEEWLTLEIKLIPLTPDLMVSAGVFLDGLQVKDGIAEINETVLDVGNKTPWLARTATYGNVMLGNTTISEHSKLTAQNNTINNATIWVSSTGLSMEHSIISDSKIPDWVTTINNSIIIGSDENWILDEKLENRVWYYNVDITNRPIYSAPWGAPVWENSMVENSKLAGNTKVINSNISASKVFDSNVDNCTLINAVLINSTVNNRTIQDTIIINDEEYPLVRNEVILKTPSKPAVSARGNGNNLVIIKLLTLNKEGEVNVEINVVSNIHTGTFAPQKTPGFDILLGICAIAVSMAVIAFERRKKR